MPKSDCIINKKLISNNNKNIVITNMEIPETQLESYNII